MANPRPLEVIPPPPDEPTEVIEVDTPAGKVRVERGEPVEL